MCFAGETLQGQDDCKNRYKEEKEMSEVEKKEINEKENKEVEEIIDESKVKTVFDYSDVLRNLRPVENVGKFNTSYTLVVQVEGIRDIEVKIDRPLYNYIMNCNSFGIKPFVSKQIVKEFSEEKNREYTCVKLVASDGNIYRAFIARADLGSLTLAYKAYQSKNKK